MAAQEDLPWLQSMDSIRTAVSVADLDAADQPLIYVNPAFTKLTGYPEHSVLHKNCRFLQGDDRVEKSRRLMREAIAAREEIYICVKNYRMNGEPFHNLLIMRCFESKGGRQYAIGCQSELKMSNYRTSAEEHLRQVDWLPKAIKAGIGFNLHATLQSYQMRAEAVQKLAEQYMMVRGT